MESLPEKLGPQLVEQMREQIHNLVAAAQLLTPVVRENGEGRYDQYLAIMNQSLHQMIRTINNLEYVQLPEEDALPRMGTLDLAGLCRQTADQVTALAKQAGAGFRYEEEKGSLITCGDPNLLRRMLLNLIGNAIRWAGAGGETGLRFSVANGRAVLMVWDNGPGLRAPEEPSDDPAQLLCRTDGLGLGLPVARRIAALHGGTLVLEQREDRGVRAIVSLPVRAPEADAEVRTPQMGYDAGGGFSPVLVELADVLPFEAFLPEDVD